MVSVLIALLVLLISCFSLVLFFGAPYLPTLDPQIEAALTLANLKPGQHLLELGCGDGRVVIAAAKSGLKVTGYELNPLLYIACLWRTRKFKGRVRVIYGNFWSKRWPQADATFTFLLPKYMEKLNQKIMQEKGTKTLVSFAFKIPNKKIDGQKNGVFLYKY